jgi:hypothetical protein
MMIRALLAIALVVLAPAVRAQAPVKFVGKYGVWEAHYAKVAGAPVCYVATVPETASRKLVKRAEVALMVSFWPKQRIGAQIKLAAGHRLKADSRVRLQFAGKAYLLWVKGQNGWADNRAMDRAIVRSLEAGNRLNVVSVPVKGPLVTDTFSLAGFTKAWAAAKKACGK